MTNSEMTFAVVVGVISALGLILGAIIASRSADAAARLAANSTRDAAQLAAQTAETTARLAAEGVANQIKLNSMVKIAEFRQAWINDLRAAMAKLSAITLRGTDADEAELYEQRARIQLLMNRNDERYDHLVRRMEQLIGFAHDQRPGQTQEFILISQEILKQEWEVLKRDLAYIPSSNVTASP